MKKTRRKFIRQSAQAALGLSLLNLYACGNSEDQANQPVHEAENPAEDGNPGKMFFNISLAQWSLHKALGIRGEATMDNLDFAATAKNKFGIEGIEYVNQFFKDKAKDTAYLAEMNKRANDHGVKQLLIMIDGAGGLAEIDDKTRNQAVENHYQWVDAAKFLGCHSIRVNAFTRSEDMKAAHRAAVAGLGKLGEFAQQSNINVIVENHGGFSSNGAWLAGVMKEINMPNVGTLPDFGNFCVKRSDGTEWGGDCVEEYDKYKGVAELMPYAKAVSAKTHNFDAKGNESEIDYMKMMKIVKDAGYKGWVGIEYEGDGLSEEEGILATKRLLEKVGKALG